MRVPQHGYALVAALGVLMVLSIIGMLVLSNTTSELRQTGATVRTAQARAAAEGAQARAVYWLSGEGQTALGQVIDPYLNTFQALGKDPQTEEFIPPDQYDEVLAGLNALSGTALSGTVTDDASYEGELQFTRLRVDPGSLSSEGQTYYVDYETETTGRVGTAVRRVRTTGTVRVRLGKMYLNQWMTVVNNYDNKIITGEDVYDGPVHINQNVALTGTPRFEKGLSTSASEIYMDANCNADWQLTSAQNLGCTQPQTATGGIQYDQQEVDMPANTFSQHRAALGLDPADTTPLTHQEESAALGDDRNAWGGAFWNRTFVPHSNGRVTGGVYFPGNGPDIELSTKHGRQIIKMVAEKNTINQNETLIVVDYENDKTYVTRKGGGLSQSVTLTLDGTINGQIYVGDNIHTLKGPDRIGTLPDPAPDIPDPAVVPPAVAARAQLNVTAGGFIWVQGDLTLEEDPRQFPDARNVLGVIAGQDDIELATMPPNPYIQAAILAGAPGQGLGSFPRPPSGKLNILGSVAQDFYRGVGQVDANGTTIAGYTMNQRYDPRFMNGSVVPPFFPTTGRFGTHTFWPVQHTWKEY